MAGDAMRGTVALGCALGVAGVLGPEFVAGFARAHPEVAVERRTSPDVQVDSDVRAGRCALGLVASPYLRGCTVRELYCCPVCFWVGVDDPLAHKALLFAEDFAGRDMAMPGAGFKSYERFTRYMLEHGTSPKSVCQMADPCRLYEFATQGRGLAFTAGRTRDEPPFAHGDLVAVPAAELSWSFGICHLEGRELSTGEKAFWDWCVSYCATIPRDPFCNKQVMGACTRVP